MGHRGFRADDAGSHQSFNFAIYGAGRRRFVLAIFIFWALQISLQGLGSDNLIYGDALSILPKLTELVAARKG